jgi:ArsR family transcriptional regulator
MPSLHSPKAPAAPALQWVASPTLDLLNAMSFTFLARDHEGVGAWPVETRRVMDPALLADLDLLHSYPRGDPGIMGALLDVVYAHPKTWSSVEALLAFVRDLPPGGTAHIGDAGIQGLAAYALRWPCDPFGVPRPEYTPAPSRAKVRASIAASDEDVEQAMSLYDDPEQVRSRMMRLIRRFYDEHYRRDEARRMGCLRRSVEAHRNETGDPQTLMNKLAGREIVCLREDGEPYTRFVFSPSTDLGVYISCSDTHEIHGFFYACEPEFSRSDEVVVAETERMADVYRALSDAQRLRILRMLQAGEMYAGEIAERTALPQSVTSRHLSYLRAVGLIVSRPQGTMKFYSLNPEMRDVLVRGAAIVVPAV